ncbi:MAG: hypothetical protein ACE5EJ_00925 [Nitrosopumilaceae archaeon]
MAKYENGYVANLRGSVAGTTFSKNKGGNYLKTKPIPTNPNTVAQQIARTNLVSSSGGFRHLDAQQKALWGQYAEDKYIPKNAVNTGQYSGFQAYSAMNLVCRSAFSRKRGAIVSANGVPITTAYTELNFLPPTNDAPTNVAVPLLASDVGDQVSMQLSSVEADVEGRFRFTLLLDGGNLNSFDQLEMPDGSAIAYAVYLSNGNGSVSESFSHPERYLLGYIPAINFDADPTELDDISEIEYADLSNLDLSIFKTFPQLNDYCVMHVYAVTQQGSLTVISSKELQMSLLLT